MTHCLFRFNTHRFCTMLTQQYLLTSVLGCHGFLLCYQGRF
jgi:hypothetical protein